MDSERMIFSKYLLTRIYYVYVNIVGVRTEGDHV